MGGLGDMNDGALPDRAGKLNSRARLSPMT
jgi:hypothetical protein